MRARAVGVGMVAAAALVLVGVGAMADPRIALNTPRPPPGTAPVPWLAVGGLAAYAISCAATARSSARAVRAAFAVVASVFAVLALRWLVLPRAFFHQNGHGPLWIDYALRDDPAACPYGPGFGELFGAAARAGGGDPDGSVFLLQAALAASVPALVFATARNLGAGRGASAALALVVALDPLLARIAQSESYFSTIATLAFAAAAALAHGARRPAPRSLPFAAGVIAAGFFVSQAARIHPIGWISLALLPIVVAIGPGCARRRLVATLAAGAGIAVLVLLTSGAELLGVLSGSLGKQWLPGAAPRAAAVAQGAGPFVLLVAVVLAGTLRSLRGLLLGALALVSLSLMYATDLLGEPNVAVDAAYDRLFWPVLLALGAAWAARVARNREHRRAVAVAIAVAGIVVAAVRFSTLTLLPTDSREASFAREWRETLPSGAMVAYVERAGSRILRLPLYDGVTPARPFPIAIDDGVPALGELAGPIYYYRSSLCATDAGRSACESLERGLPLEPVIERELPALPSMRWHPYARDSVHVELSRRP